MESKDIKHVFHFKDRPTVEILIRYDDLHFCQVIKTIYADNYCTYESAEWWLDSFDDTHHKDYPIETVMDTLWSSKDSSESISGTETFWNHP